MDIYTDGDCLAESFPKVRLAVATFTSITSLAMITPANYTIIQNGSSLSEYGDLTLKRHRAGRKSTKHRGSDDSKRSTSTGSNLPALASPAGHSF